MWPSHTRPRRATLLFFVALFALAACDQGSSPTQPTAINGNGPGPAATNTTTSGGSSGPTLTKAPASHPNALTDVEADIGYQTLDPSFCYDTGCDSIIMNVYEPLIYPNKEKATDFVPLLATKWDVSSDGKTYTFTIRKGVKFHQGQDLTPEDVAYTFWRNIIQDRAGGYTWILLQPLFGLDVQSFKDDIVGKLNNNNWVAGCEAIKKAITFDNNAGTVAMHLKAPYGPLLQIIQGFSNVVSKQWVAQLGGWNGDCATAQKYHDPKPEQDELYKVMNGTGPYMLDRWTPNEELVLTRNPNYWRTEPAWPGAPTGPASIEKITIKESKEWGTRLSTLKAGDADFIAIPVVDRPQVDALVKETCDASGQCTSTNQDGVLRLWKGLTNSTSAFAIYMNQQVDTTGGNPKLGSGKLDGQGIPPDFFSDLHVRKAFNYCFDWNTFIKDVYKGEADQVYGPIIKGELGYDPNQAHYSLDLQKCADEFKAATLKSPDGRSLWDTGFYLQMPYLEGNPHVPADILKADLGKANPKFKLEPVAEAGSAIQKDMDASRLPIVYNGWVEDFHDPHDWVFPYMATGGYYSSIQHFSKDLQAQFDQLVVQGVQQSNPQDRAATYGKLQNLAYENAIDIFTVQPQNRVYQPLWLKGWFYNPVVFWSDYYDWSINR